MHKIKLPLGTLLLSLLSAITACDAPSGGDVDASLEPVASSAQALSHNWSASFREPFSYQEPQQVAVDGSGNVIIAGYYGVSVNFGGSTLTTSAFTAGFVASFSSAGIHLWSKSIDSLDIFGVAVDSSDNVIITGVMYDDTDFGGGTVTNSSSLGSSMFVAKFDSSGTHLWSSSFGGGAYAAGQEIAVDSSDNVLVIGRYYDDLTIGSDSNSISGGCGGVLAKFNSSGVPLFARFFESSNPSNGVYGNGIAVDPSDDSVAITGAFKSTVDFGGGPLTSNTSGAQYDALVAKYDSSGNELWSSSFGTGETWGNHVAIDSSGDIIVSGYFKGSVDFGSNTSTLTNLGSISTYVAKFDDGGTDLWSIHFGNAKTWYHGLALNSADDVLLSGSFSNSVNFGGGTFTPTGGDDAFFAQWDTTGGYVDSASYGTWGWQGVTAVAVDSSDNTVLLGAFDGSVDFGGGWLPNLADDTFALDTFLAHLSP
ncbi:hypothetical protein WMF18_25040 [Sorangium sp. So ce315]|uniref:hypothetical protein n=1 Tax=Sorangium sp. So ce315 TaxID=3133299 RepID=UPI003F611B99